MKNVFVIGKLRLRPFLSFESLGLNDKIEIFDGTENSLRITYNLIKS